MLRRADVHYDVVEIYVNYFSRAKAGKGLLLLRALLIEGESILCRRSKVFVYFSTWSLFLWGSIGRSCRQVSLVYRYLRCIFWMDC